MIAGIVVSGFGLASVYIAPLASWLINIVGLAKNARIDRLAKSGMARAAAAYERSGEKQRLFVDLSYGANTWSKRRRVIARLEQGVEAAG